MKHNKMLHGSTRRYCNVMHVHNMVKKMEASHTVDVNDIPTDDDLYEADLRAGPNTLMQMLDVDFHGHERCYIL